MNLPSQVSARVPSHIRSLPHPHATFITATLVPSLERAGTEGHGGWQKLHRQRISGMGNPVPVKSLWLRVEPEDYTES